MTFSQSDSISSAGKCDSARRQCGDFIWYNRASHFDWLGTGKDRSQITYGRIPLRQCPGNADGLYIIAFIPIRTIQIQRWCVGRWCCLSSCVRTVTATMDVEPHFILVQSCNDDILLTFLHGCTAYSPFTSQKFYDIFSPMAWFLIHDPHTRYPMSLTTVPEFKRASDQVTELVHTWLSNIPSQIDSFPK